MATPSGTIDTDLEQLPLREALASEPFRFRFFQAVRLLQRLTPERNPVGKFVHPSTEVVRFSARQSLTFPPSEVHALETVPAKPPRMTVNFMGLTGPEGMLPLCYTEFVMERLQKRDTALADFFDIFNHRFISLFYQAWEKHHFGVRYERGEKDLLSEHLGDLIGLGTAGLQNRLLPEVRDESLFYYTGLLAQRPHSAVALEQVLEDYFEVPVAVEQFAGMWYRLEKKSQTCLQETDRPYESLGFGAVVGDEVWDQQSLARIRLGPLSLDEYLDFLPTGNAYGALKSLVRFYSGDEIDFEVQLVLRRDETPPATLGSEGKTAPQLGWVTWVKTAPMGRDPRETIIRL
ncbi:MAG: type VI secretion system baseplate subunit TssG [Acidobacteria bacterium]|jgi:type VI secretion system protein ImpH|nr:MAG: type VI secretion system baseplate subunit TssG [Acidobacteriota bacterium]